MKGAPRSKEFDDVYFSAVDGLAETRHVFLQGNGLPGRWAGRENFVIAETGFGTGLNFLAVWKLFMDTAQVGQRLDFISFEKHPLSAAEIREYLVPLLSSRAKSRDLTPDATGLDPSTSLCFGRDDNEGFEKYLQEFSELYPKDMQDIQRVPMNEFVSLTLIIGDVNEEMPKLQAAVDAWFLDGFRPKTNPQMWTETVFENMGRLSATGATFATFTAVGYVKRGLKAAGFDVQRVRGFGSKWHMLIGTKQ